MYRGTHDAVCTAGCGLTGLQCLNGITRKHVIDLCRAGGIPVFEQDFSLVQVYSADEAFVTGTFGGLTPVIEVDGHVIGEGKPGTMTRRLRELYISELIGRLPHEQQFEYLCSTNCGPRRRIGRLALV